MTIQLSEELVFAIESRSFYAGQKDGLVGHPVVGSGYIIGTNGWQSDSGEPNALLYLNAGDHVIRLTPLVNPDLVTAITEAFSTQELTP